MIQFTLDADVAGRGKKRQLTPLVRVTCNGEMMLRGRHIDGEEIRRIIAARDSGTLGDNVTVVTTATYDQWANTDYRPPT